MMLSSADDSIDGESLDFVRFTSDLRLGMDGILGLLGLVLDLGMGLDGEGGLVFAWKVDTRLRLDGDECGGRSRRKLSVVVILQLVSFV